MIRTAEDYKGLLQALLPPGQLWDALREPGGLFDDLSAALAEEFARVDGRAAALVGETDPRSTSELLTEWEAFAGLPDPCVGDPDNTAQRREALLARLTAVGGQSPQYFIDMAAALGYTVTITEFRPPLADQAVVGDALTYGDWVYTFSVNAPETTTYDAVAGVAAAGEPLRAWGNKALECSIRRWRPAQTIVLFTYGG